MEASDEVKVQVAKEFIKQSARFSQVLEKLHLGLELYENEKEKTPEVSQLLEYGIPALREQLDNYESMLSKAAKILSVDLEQINLLKELGF